jgi:hypothetical protein
MVGKMVKSLGASLLAVAVVATLQGCGGTTTQYNDAVEGTVTLDNQPLGGALIQFIPDGVAGAVTSQAVSDDQGHFKLVREDQRSGAAVTKHKVVVTRGRAADPRHRGETTQPALSKDTRPVPSIYAVGAKTPLEQAVTADKHTGYDLVLSSKAGGTGLAGREDH